MSEKSSFFDSVNADRVYYAADWALHMAQYFTNGIFNNGLSVVSNNDMSVTVNIGDANISGYRYKNDSQKVINVANADGILNRIDNVVIRLDIPNRQITTEIITGTFAEEAVAPALVRGTSIYDLRITQDLITDCRFNSNDCGNVICAVQSPDFTNILNQYEALWNSLITEKEGNFEQWFEEKTQNFAVWFEKIKNQLSGDIAGKLQLQVNDLQQIVMEAISPITTEDGEILATEDGEYIVAGL